MENTTEQQTRTTFFTFRRVWSLPSGELVTAINVGITHLMLTHTTPRVVAFDMKKTLDSFMDSVSQKQLSEAQSKALSDRFNEALEQSPADYQKKNGVLIWFHRPWFRAHPM